MSLARRLDDGIPRVFREETSDTEQVEEITINVVESDEESDEESVEVSSESEEPEIVLPTDNAEDAASDEQE